MAETPPARAVTYDLLRSLRLTTVFGNPGSTEETFLQEFPADFSYVLALQEASAIAMADAFAQVTRRPALVNLHSSAGVGNAMGNLVAAYHGNTPLIVTAGQQHRELMIGEPYLGNREATTMPKPGVRWSYEPYRAQDVPEAFMRAYALAVQPPAGRVFLSIPRDDWNEPLAGPARGRTVSTSVAPEAERLRQFADRISASRRPGRIFCPAVDRGRRAGGEAERRRLRGPAERPGLLPRGPPIVPRPARHVRQDDQRPADRPRPGRRDRRRGVPLLPLRARRPPPRGHRTPPDHRQPRGRRVRAGRRRPAGRPQDRDRAALRSRRGGFRADRPRADGAAAGAAAGAEQPAHPAGGLRRAEPGPAAGFGHRQRVALHHGPADRVAPDGPDRIVLRHGQRGHRLGRAGRGRRRAGRPRAGR